MKSERAYTQQARLVNADLTRLALVRAAIALISAPAATELTMDAVAKQAGVSRMTVFNSFGDKRTLLVAVYDMLSEAGRLDDVTDILNLPNIDQAWTRYLKRFAQFYQQHHAVLRQLRGMAARDVDFEAVLCERDARKDMGIGWLLQRQLGHDPAQQPRGRVLAISRQISAAMCFEVLDGLTLRSSASQAITLWLGMIGALRKQ